MILPEGLEQAFWSELKAYEEERKVPYISHTLPALKRLAFSVASSRDDKKDSKHLFYFCWTKD